MSMSTSDSILEEVFNLIIIKKRKEEEKVGRKKQDPKSENGSHKAVGEQVFNRDLINEIRSKRAAFKNKSNSTADSALGSSCLKSDKNTNKKRRSRSRSYERYKSTKDRNYSKRSRSRSRDRRRSGNRERRGSRSRERRRSSSRDRQTISRSKERPRSRSRDRYESRNGDRRETERRRLNEMERERLRKIAEDNVAKGHVVYHNQSSIHTPSSITSMHSSQYKSDSSDLSTMISKCRDIRDGEIDPATEYANRSNINHPFSVPDTPVIPRMYLPSSSSSSNRLAISDNREKRLSDFPVSSGNAHRSDEVKAAAKAFDDDDEKVNVTHSVSSEIENKDKEDDTPTESMTDIKSVVEKRISALRKLSENPSDPQALTDISQCQRALSSWADGTVKEKCGKFTGHTGASILSQDQLSLGFQAWAKPDQFISSKKVSGGFGEYLMRKMGWSDGQGLGKDKSGPVNPLQLDLKLDKKGLHTEDERRNRNPKTMIKTAVKMHDLTDKHPISAIMEFASKNKWNNPIFTEVMACSTKFKKLFFFKVEVNGQAYQPTVGSETKKQAKFEAAKLALQGLGLIDVDESCPI